MSVGQDASCKLQVAGDAGKSYCVVRRRLQFLLATPPWSLGPGQPVIYNHTHLIYTLITAASEAQDN